MLTVINFHYIRESFDSNYPSIFGITPRQFEDQLIELSKHGNFISQGTLRTFIKEGKELPLNSLLITFDDGLLEQYELALPILNKLDIPAIFFVCSKPVIDKEILDVHMIHEIKSRISPTLIFELLESEIKNSIGSFDFKYIRKKSIETYRYDNEIDAINKYILNYLIDKSTKKDIFNRLLPEIYNNMGFLNSLYMNIQQLQELSKMDFLGFHGYDHSPIGKLNMFDKVYQVNHAKVIFEKKLGVRLDTFSYPYGTYSASNGMAKILKESGYKMAFTMERGINSSDMHPFYIARFDTNDVPLGKSYKHTSSELFLHLPKSRLKYDN